MTPEMGWEWVGNVQVRAWLSGFLLALAHGRHHMKTVSKLPWVLLPDLHSRYA